MPARMTGSDGVKVFEAVKIHHYGSGSNSDRHELRNSRDELNIYRLFLNENNCVERISKI